MSPDAPPPPDTPPPAEAPSPIDPAPLDAGPPPSPGALLVARLLCGLPADLPDPAALPDRWRRLASAVQHGPEEVRLALFDAALAAHPDPAALTSALAALAPGGPGLSDRSQTVPPPTLDTRHPSPDWPPPLPLADVELPPFPVDALPGWLRDFVVAEATATQTPTDLAGLLALAVLSAACAGRFAVRPWGDWTEPVNLYVLVVLPPGHRKSAVLASVTRPLLNFEAESARRLAPTIAQAESRRAVVEQSLRLAQDAAARARPDRRAACRADVERLTAELSALVLPTAPRLVVDDCTPERLATVLHEQGGRVAVLSPEGGVFDLMAGRYGTGTPNLDHFLKGHAGDPIIVDRVDRPPDLVPRPAITMGLAVQPDVLRGLMARPGFHGRGLLARFLYALPPSPLGRRAVDPPPVPEPVRAAYHAHVRALLSQAPPAGGQRTAHHPSSFTDPRSGRGQPHVLRPPTPDPHVLTLTEPAAARLRAFAADLEPRLGEFGDLERLVDWGAKLVGAVARLAALLHLAHHAGMPPVRARQAGTESRPAVPASRPALPPLEPIPEHTIAAAIALGEYATAHARAAYAAMGSDPVVDDARYLLRWIERAGTAAFTRRAAFVALQARFRRAELLDPALDLLERHGYLRRQLLPTRPGPGRKPSPIFAVNPHCRRHTRSGAAASPS